ncbi:hypothetical protein V1478_018963, partial [Vespula squamosa]
QSYDRLDNGDRRRRDDGANVQGTSNIVKILKNLRSTNSSSRPLIPHGGALAHHGRAPSVHQRGNAVSVLAYKSVGPVRLRWKRNFGKVLEYAAFRPVVLASYCTSIYCKYYRPRSHHVEVAAYGDPRANVKTTGRSPLRDEFKSQTLKLQSRALPQILTRVSRKHSREYVEYVGTKLEFNRAREHQRICQPTRAPVSEVKTKLD